MELLTVGEVTAYLNALLRSDPVLSDLWVEGEINSLSRSPAGHYYFNLRDEASQLRCVLFRGSAARLGLVPEPGAAVVAHGRVSFYEAGGSCQLNVDLLYPKGVGLARLELEALKLKLELEGLFAVERKRPLPPFPRRIGLVTSDGGAVLHDIVQVLGRRYPLVEVILAAASVQGERAAGEICAALDRLADLHRRGEPLDLVIVARGGGSETDLAVFNDERVARAFFGCPVPIVSAIGHETDLTLVDFVADLRAPTPSAAAELVAPDAEILRQMVESLVARAGDVVERRLEERRRAVGFARDRLLSSSPRAAIVQRRGELQLARRRAESAVRRDLGLAREQTHGRWLQLLALSPKRTLRRGYAICTVEGGAVLISVQQAVVGERLEIRVSDGVVSGQTVEGSPRPDR